MKTSTAHANTRLCSITPLMLNWFRVMEAAWLSRWSPDTVFGAVFPPLLRPSPASGDVSPVGPLVAAELPEEADEEVGTLNLLSTRIDFSCAIVLFFVA